MTMSPEYKQAIKRVQLRARNKIIDGCQKTISEIGDQIYRYPEIEGDPEVDESIIYAAIGRRVDVNAENTLTQIYYLIDRTADREMCVDDLQNITLYPPIEWLVLLGVTDQEAAVALIESFTPAELVAMNTDTWLWTCQHSSLESMAT